MDSAKTNDKVFLLSYNDVCNSNYGFNSNLSIADIARRVQGTDYAESQGLNVFKDINSPYRKNSKWILRSPGDFSGGCCGISYYGFASFDYSVDITEYGIRPALIINQLSGIKHTHNYSSNVIVPTCTTKGYTVNTCQCGDNYIANYVDIVNHKDSDNNYKCDFNCGYKFENPADSCSCNCHARGLKAFFFKISIFFQKLFGKNQICACGAIHY